MRQQRRRYGRAWRAAWIVIVLVSVIGWAALATAPAAAQDGAGWACVEVNEGGTLNIRSGPGVIYGVIATRQTGAQFDADFARQQVADGYTWTPVRLANGAQGWTIARRIDPCPVPDTAPAPTSAPPANVPDTPPADLPTMNGVNTDGVLDRYEIATVARSVVLLANLRGTRIQATGTGTITAPSGLIVTNAHVVEDADRIAVGVLTDINDPPEFRYIGRIVRIDDTVDVALVEIESDIDGRPVNTASLDLPYIPTVLDASDVFRGDPVYIFGYPGIGNDFLVVTTGSIVSVENGMIEGQRMPVWFRTDAEIAPGNSGGLVVNGNGQFLGIPTFVESEDLTGGRLGGIRPAQVALMALTEGDSFTAAVDALPPDSTPDMPAPNTSEALPYALPVTVETQAVQLRHNAVRYGETGITFEVNFTITGWQQQAAQVVARVFHDDLASAPLLNPAAPSQYRDDSGAVRVAEPIEPCCPQTLYAGDAALELFLPYSAFGFNAPGSYPLKIQVAVEAGDLSWQSTLSWEFVVINVQ